ncbi:MAG: hypothetical protein DRI93_00675 [Aquificota bacterium]|nr:MAG: hypothetical protein DRI93_00675 [Aquificota bacterium]
MNLLEETIKRVESFSEEELRAFREWFEEFDARIWDEKLERDVRAGKLDDLVTRAMEDFKKGKCTEL